MFREKKSQDWARNVWIKKSPWVVLAKPISPSSNTTHPAYHISTDWGRGSISDDERGTVARCAEGFVVWFCWTPRTHRLGPNQYGDTFDWRWPTWANTMRREGPKIRGGGKSCNAWERDHNREEAEGSAGLGGHPENPPLHGRAS